MTRDKKFLWCSLHQQKRPLAGCPRCGRFPCAGMTPEQLGILAQSVSLHRTLRALPKRRIKTMFFLKDQQGTLSTYGGKLEDLDHSKASQIVEALEVSSFYVQELTWVPASRERTTKAAATSKPRLCVIELTQGAFQLEEIDPAVPREDAAKIYPVDKRYLRRFVAVKVTIDDSPPAKKSKSSRTPSAEKT